MTETARSQRRACSDGEDRPLGSYDVVLAVCGPPLPRTTRLTAATVSAVAGADWLQLIYSGYGARHRLITLQRTGVRLDESEVQPGT